VGYPIFVTGKDKIPDKEHYAIFKFSTQSTSTYEANDGSVTVIGYEAYLDKGAWLAEIEHLEKLGRDYGHKEYAAVVIKPVKVVSKIQVEVE
jgi:hypothetical protein